MIMFLAVVVAAATLVVLGTSLADPVECSGDFPIFVNTAMSEPENEERIACVSERRQVIADRISERREKRADITDRIQQLKHRKDEIKKRIERDKERAQPLGAVIRLLSY